MDKDQMITVIKEKVKLPDDVAEKAAELLDGKSLVGHANKDDIVKTLVEKLKIDEKVANKIYEAVAGALAGGIVDNIKGLFGKK